MISPAEKTPKFSKLVHLHVAGLKLNDLCWQQFKLGIQRTRVLRNFIVNMTTISRDQL